MKLLLRQCNGVGIDAFSLPELIISSLILAIAVLASAQLYNSSNRVRIGTGLRNATEHLIDIDLAAISKRNEHFTCKGSVRCDVGTIDHSSSSYFPVSSSEIAAFEGYCATSTQLVDLLIAQIDSNQPAPDGVYRSIVAAPVAGQGSGHLYTVTYYADSAKSLRLRQAIFTPTVAAWCP